MKYQNSDIAGVAKKLMADIDKPSNKRSILRSPELAALYDQLKALPSGQDKAAFGRELNALRQELEQMTKQSTEPKSKLEPIDVTAPFDVNQSLDSQPELMSAEVGSRHPLMSELDEILDIFGRMGFDSIESRQLDDDYHMFSSLNFPEGHPARDDLDTFMTEESLIAPAHTSTMQNRVLKQYKANLEKNQPIAVVIPGRVYRNEDVDASHEHTFHQVEGVYVSKNANVGNLIATLQAFLTSYYKKELDFKFQPFYFPFTEPSLEIIMSCPFCDKKGCNICQQTGWIEILGCGMIHPNVLKEAGIDPRQYTGFAWGMGTMRLVMMKYGIEDIRHFQSGNLKFLRQFR